MNRAMIGAGIGIAFGMMALIAYGAWWGFTNGVNWKTPKLQPGWAAAMESVVTVSVYFWWAACGVGAVIGGLAGFGSWLVRPHQDVRPA